MDYWSVKIVCLHRIGGSGHFYLLCLCVDLIYLGFLCFFVFCLSIVVFFFLSFFLIFSSFLSSSSPFSRKRKATISVTEFSLQILCDLRAFCF